MLPTRLTLFARGILAASVLLLIMGSGCKKSEVPHFLLKGYDQANLVSDINGYGAVHIDSFLINPWGIAVAPSGPIWISANNSGTSPIYDKEGMTLRPPVIIPAPGSPTGGAPTGIVFNGTADFMFHHGKTMMASKFIFATEDGTLAAWGGGDTATIVADQSPAAAVYKGLAMANDGGSNFLYAANFKQSKIDVFDANFNLVSGKPFMDPGIPSDFGPFNIRNIGGWLYVTYAKHKPPMNHDDTAGAGNGFVNIFKPNGSMVKRFITKGPLNSPWGIVKVTVDFGLDMESAILVGNFGDGRINVFDDDGRFAGPLSDNGHAIVIQGLWGLENNVKNADPRRLYFTAGIKEEQHGLFGYLIRH